METKAVKILLFATLCFFLGLSAAEDMLPEDLEDPADDPLAFDSDYVYSFMEEGVPLNTRAFVSGSCLVRITVAGFPIPFPITVSHITMHVPDLLVNVSAQPFSSLWIDPAKTAQETVLKLSLKSLYSTPIGGGILSTKNKGLSYTRSKDVEIYGNPWTIPSQINAVAKWVPAGNGKQKPKLTFEAESQKGFYDLAKQSFPQIKFGCFTSFLPTMHVYNSELDPLWRFTTPLDLLQALTLGIIRTVGPGWFPLGVIGDIAGLGQVLSPFFPLKGTVTNAIHAHGAAVNALRAAYIATSSWSDFAIWTGHFPQYPGSVLQSCLSTECETFTSEEEKWGKDKVGLWQLIAPPVTAEFESSSLAFPLDSEEQIEYLKLVDQLVPAARTKEIGFFQRTNPGEKYSFLHWRCHKCCDVPRGIPNVFSVELIKVVPGLSYETCEPPFPPIDAISAFKNQLKKKLKKLQEGKAK